MEYKDYYKILGVEKSATREEIKKQYRRLTRKFHPDVNPGDKQAASKFAEINEAHEVLIDDEKRKKYDTLGSNWQQYENSKQESPFQKRYPEKNGTAYSFYEGNIDDILGAGGFSDFFKTFFGDSFSGVKSGKRAYSQKGQDYKAELEIKLEEAYSKCIKINPHYEHYSFFHLLCEQETVLSQALYIVIDEGKVFLFLPCQIVLLFRP